MLVVPWSITRRWSRGNGRPSILFCLRPSVGDESSTYHAPQPRGEGSPRAIADGNFHRLISLDLPAVLSFHYRVFNCDL